MVAYLLVSTLIERRRPPMELAPRRALGLVWGLLGGAVVFGVLYLLIMAFGGFRFEGAATVDWSAWWVRVLVTGAGIGIVEEIMLRGILYRIVEEFTGTWIATALSGILFGLAHLTNPQATRWGAVAIGLEAGVLFALLYAFTRSLWIVIGFHAGWNLAQGPILGGFVAGTNSPPSLFHTSVHGPDLITGGDFGPEASMIALGFLLIVTAVLCRLLVKHRAVVAPMWIRRARQRAELDPGARQRTELT
ncbi:MAG: CPBP family intramembrane metalloprotease [Propionibacteriaceae bacterium]|nr:CPBP family intramembrane metalloprotease [Propionibacteriaceae bacterium]